MWRTFICYICCVFALGSRPITDLNALAQLVLQTRRVSSVRQIVVNILFAVSLISFTDNVETAAVTMETEEDTEACEAAPAC